METKCGFLSVNVAQLNQQECHIWSRLKKHSVCACVLVCIQVEKFHYSIILDRLEQVPVTVMMLVWFPSNTPLGLQLLRLQNKRFMTEQ